MQRLEFEIVIDAPREKVWNTMLEEPTYGEWTAAFSPGSGFEGSWAEGSEINFVDPSGSGMHARVVENREFEYVELQHIGMIADGKVDTTSPEIAEWAPALESYEFVDADGATLLKVLMETDPKHAPMFEELWPKALDGLKAIAER